MQKKLSTITIAAIVIGNALEWYDYLAYSFMTAFIAKAFFPHTSHLNSILAATATFGVAFCVRPLGGILIGWYADKYGRKPAMLGMMFVMLIAILIMIFTPDYSQIGMFAPMLIVLARVLQGLSAGGEFGTATALLAELAPSDKRGFYCAFQMIAQGIAMLLGAGISLILTTTLSMEELSAWGWRLPFIFGLIIFPLGIYIRKHLNENFVPQVIRQRESQHLIKRLLVVTGLVVMGSVTTYINLSHMPTYAYEYWHLPLRQGFAALSIGMLVNLMAIILAGCLSDKIGRKPVLIMPAFIYILSIYPLFLWINYAPSLIKLITFEVITAGLLGIYYGAFAAAVAELFPQKNRSMQLSLCYNTAAMIFGGFSPFIVTYLIAELHTPLAVVYYLLLGVSISLIAAIFYPQSRKYNEYESMAITPHCV